MTSATPFIIAGSCVRLCHKSPRAVQVTVVLFHDRFCDRLVKGDSDRLPFDQFPVAFDGGAWMKKMGCDSFPDYVLIDKKGVTRVVDLANAEIERAVVKLLEE